MRAIGPTATGLSVAAFVVLCAFPAAAQEAPAAALEAQPAAAPASVQSDPLAAPAVAAEPATEAPAAKPDAPISLDQITTYGTLGLGAGTGDAHGAPGDVGIFSSQVGARFGPYVGVEAEAGTGFADDGSSGKHLNLASRYAGYLVGYLPFGKHFDLFAKLGLGHSRYKYEDNGSSVTSNFDSVNWGVGAQYFFNDHDGVRTEVLKETYHDNRGDRSNLFFSWIHRF